MYEIRTQVCLTGQATPQGRSDVPLSFRRSSVGGSVGALPNGRKRYALRKMRAPSVVNNAAEIAHDSCIWKRERGWASSAFKGSG
jgi:hypothetical protein